MKPKKYEKKVSKRMQTWVDEYLLCGDAYQAAKNAGYRSPSATAVRLQALPQIKNLIKAKQAHIARESRMADVVTMDAKIKRLWDIATKDRSDTESELAADRNAIAAMAELNRMQGHLAAEKYVGVQLVSDVDMQRGQQEMLKLLDKSKSEF